MLKHVRDIHADDLVPDDILDGGSVVVRVEDSYDNVDMVAVYIEDEDEPRLMFNEDFVGIFSVVESS